MTMILVTGGAGFIGASLVPMLLGQGDRVRVLDNLSVGSAAALAGLDVELIAGDIRDRATVDAAVAGVGGVVHLAAHTSVIDSVHEPQMDFAVNVGGTLNLLLACRDRQVPRFVFASSNAPIGENTPPIDEDKPARPLSPYGASKLAGEGYCSAFHGSYGLGTVILRFANVYGPRSTHKGSVVAKFIKDAMSTGILTIYGDGEQTRDFIYVEDLCRAILAGLTSDVGGETFQIATGTETRILDLAQRVRAAFPERRVEIVHAGQRAGEIIKNYSSIAKAQRVLGWSPQVPLAEGLANTVASFTSLANIP
jgi:UDP-glucose 4-epimerase